MRYRPQSSFGSMPRPLREQSMHQCVCSGFSKFFCNNWWPKLRTVSVSPPLKDANYLAEIVTRHFILCTVKKNIQIICFFFLRLIVIQFAKRSFQSAICGSNHKLENELHVPLFTLTQFSEKSTNSVVSIASESFDSVLMVSEVWEMSLPMRG